MQSDYSTIGVVQEFPDMVKRGRGRPPGKREVVRITVALEPEVYETFKQMGQAAGVSLARVVGDWCRDTVEGAQFVTQRVIQARQSPKVVMRDLHMGAAELLNYELLEEKGRGATRASVSEAPLARRSGSRGS